MTNNSDTTPLPPNGRSRSESQTARQALRSARAMAPLPLPSDPPKVRPRILFIDDEAVNTENADNIYRNSGLAAHADLIVFLYNSSTEAELIIIIKDSFDQNRLFTAIYVDLNLREGGRNAGLGLIQRLRAEEPRLRYAAFVAVTAFPDYAIERRARDSGAVRFMIKFNPDAGDVLGGFVYRMIMEANETLEQCEDQLWADASTLLSKTLLEKTWREAFGITLDFIDANFLSTALFVRREEGNGRLKLLDVRGSLGAIPSDLPLRDVPFIERFLRRRESPYDLIEHLSASQVGSVLPTHLVGMRAMLVRIALGPSAQGLMGIYRLPSGHPFRMRDATGLMQIASQLANAIVADEETQRLRGRQREIIDIMRDFDAATEGEEIYSKLQSVLFEQIGATAAGGQLELRCTIRWIEAGTNLAVPALESSGFRLRNPPPAISLENIRGSSVARAVWHGRVEYDADVSLESERDRHVQVDPNIRATLCVPLMAGGRLCLGMAILESRKAAAFSEQDREFAELLCVAAAESLLRIRGRRFLEGMAQLVESLTASGTGNSDKYVERIVDLLFTFTRCSEILYFVPNVSDERAPWILQRIFVHPDREKLDESSIQKARQYSYEKWFQSHGYQTLASGEKANYSNDPEQIVVDDEPFANRAEGAKTRAQAAIVVRRATGHPPDAVISLLFQHRHALNEQQMNLLERLGIVLASLLASGREFRHLFGLASIREQEARLGRVFGQFRHGMRGRLAKLRANLELAEHGDISLSELSVRAITVLDDLELDIDRNRAVVKAPVFEYVRLDVLWNVVANELDGVARKYHGRIRQDELANISVWSDNEILKSVMFNLVDNALRHGGAGTEVSAKAMRRGQRVGIEISDNGVGISPYLREKIFTPVGSTSPDSTGMGLYLSHSLAADLGGTLSLIRTGVDGTSFKLDLPGTRP